MSETSDVVLSRLCNAIERKVAIDYGIGIPDKEYPEITWARYGLPKTNEILVTATVGDLCVAAAGISLLLAPKMQDRVYGIDPDDLRLASELSMCLWEAESVRLVTEALRVRERYY